MDWLLRTDWPAPLQQFIEEFACSPLATHSKSVDSNRLSNLAKTHAPSKLADALASSLYLAANDLEASHEISQGIHTSVGSYLHGIMHRREKDFSNAKYWFHQAGELDYFDRIADNLAPTTIAWLKENDTHWRFDPIQLTDWHRVVVNRSNPDAVDSYATIEDLAWQEWRCVTNAILNPPQH